MGAGGVAEDWGADACGFADPQPLAAIVTAMIIPARIGPRIRVMAAVTRAGGRIGRRPARIAANAGLCDRRAPDRHGK